MLNGNIKLLTLGATLLLSSVTCGVTFGQAPTTVQLPTFHFFTVQTTVSVPDSGGTYLGGINRAVDSSRTRGLGSRGSASGRSVGGMSVHATIHDLASMDEALLASAAAKRVTPLDTPADAPVNRAPGLVGPASAPVQSVAAIRQQQAGAADAQAAEIAGLYAKAVQADAEKKPVVAKLYYQMVARRDTGNLKQQSLARLDVLTGKSSRIAGR